MKWFLKLAITDLRKLQTLIHVGLVLLNVLNVSDMLLTYFGLRLGGAELNPFFGHFNTVGILWSDVLVKTGMVTFSSLAVWLVTRRALRKQRKLTMLVIYGFTFGLVALYIIVVVNNIFILRLLAENVEG